MAEAGSWASIQRHGLLSTSALLNLFGYNGEHREAIEARHRAMSVQVYHPVHGGATIRDQKPLNEVKVANCLTDGLSPQDWYLTLNARVFFWAAHERLIRLLNARAYRDKAHDVIFIDTSRLVEKCLERLELSRINSGSTLMNAPKRGRNTFVPLRDCSLGQDVVEIAVRELVPNMEEVAMQVLRMQRDAVLATVWERRRHP